MKTQGNVKKYVMWKCYVWRILSQRVVKLIIALHTHQSML